jgi:protein-S-isoprenylcysteine O-methyltransferase Ste14
MRLAAQTLASTLSGVVFFAGALFLPAGTLNYWQAWVFIAVFTVSTLVPSIWLAWRDPAALQRRMHVGPVAETRPVQRIVISATGVSVVALLVVSALDHRFGWSQVPIGVVVAGNVLVAAGLILAQWVVFQNRYAAATITVEAGQTLVSTGLYGVVRHPMYLGALVMLVGTPPALGSYWGALVLIPGVLTLVMRIVDEEKMLSAELDGYREYTRRVPYRVIPHLF